MVNSQLGNGDILKTRHHRGGMCGEYYNLEVRGISPPSAGKFLALTTLG